MKFKKKRNKVAIPPTLRGESAILSCQIPGAIDSSDSVCLLPACVW
jgi:hypothetical protein